MDMCKTDMAARYVSKYDGEAKWYTLPVAHWFFSPFLRSVPIY
jgi:hypothetical protein